MGEGKDNKPVEVDTSSIKQTAEDVSILNKKPWSSPKSLASNLRELPQLKREQMNHNTRFKVMQSNIEERSSTCLKKNL